MVEAVMVEAVMVEAVMVEAVMVEAVVAEAVMAEAVMAEAVMVEAVMVEAVMAEAEMVEAVMAEAVMVVMISGAASASRAGPSSRIYPAKSEPDLASIGAPSDAGRRVAPTATPRAAAQRAGQQAAPMTQPVNRTKPRTKSPPPVKPVSCHVISVCKIAATFFCRQSAQLELELDSTRVRVNALGHIPTPLLSVEGCCRRLFPGESRSLKIFLDDTSPVFWLVG